MSAIDDLLGHLRDLSTSANKDCLIYIGGINRQGYELVSEKFKEKGHEEAYLFLATYGGDPDAGFRIARALRHHYKRLTILVPTYCKSAGTLLAIGADELVISDKGELGPLDMQLKKPDELFDMSSGLDITQAMEFLRTQSAEILKSTLLDLKIELEVTTKTAAEIATKLAHGLVSPIYAQIDPYKIGESQRAIAIAFSYGQRLDEKVKNLKNTASLKSLVLDYPSHGFVIDRKEATKLFKNVRAPADLEQIVIDELYDLCKNPGSQNPIVTIISNQPLDTDTTEGNGNVSADHRATATADQGAGEQILDARRSHPDDESHIEGAGEVNQTIPGPQSNDI